MLKAGQYNTLSVQEVGPDTIRLSEGITIPSKYIRGRPRVGEEVKVFMYHDTKGEWVASTLTPKAVVGELATLKVIDMTPDGAFLDWGLPKDLFLPRSFHEDDLQVGDYCLVKVMVDEHSGKVIAKETLGEELSNENLTVREKEVVRCIVYKNTDLGYQVIINGKHLGLLHYNEVFKELFAGDMFTGFIKKIKEDGKIDVMIGKPGYSRVEDEAEPVLSRLQQNGGFLPYHDKSPADDIYKVFGMSKKTFKMTIGNLYRDKKILITEKGIELVK